MASLFAVTLFVSAWLLFALQPMIGKVLLPKLGGSPAVWNTCLLFFQATLLLGYLYSHALSSWSRIKAQSLVHLLLLIGVLLVLPGPLKNWQDSPRDLPILWLLGFLVLSIGLPFFALSTTSPLLQKWFSDLTGRDPYFLSISSNGGSLALLLAYPIFVEPNLDLDQQFQWWSWGYLIDLILLGFCTVLIQIKTLVPQMAPSGNDDKHEGESPWLWVLLAFIPSSLLSGVTSTITTDVAPIPLLWVIPLSLYLLTFMIAFAPIRLPIQLLGRASILAGIVLTLTILAGATEPLTVVLAIHLGTFFILALLCHVRLSQLRPDAGGLTRYYLLLSLGGVLGGAFNAILAPLLFHRLGFVEYPLIFLLACLMRPGDNKLVSWNWTDCVAPVVLGLVIVALEWIVGWPSWIGWISRWSQNSGIPVEMLKIALVFAMPLIGCYLLSDRPVRFTLALAVLILAGHFAEKNLGKLLLSERNFLGVVQVTQSPDGQFTRMVHGNTIHGQQRKITTPADLQAALSILAGETLMERINLLAIAGERILDSQMPLTYYYPSGPAGKVFRHRQQNEHREIVVVGLGTGALASYARSNEAWTFIELDPAVEKIARDDHFFTFLRDSRAGQLQVLIGDGRLQLLKLSDGSVDLLILDAFSSDAIPLHLLTREAFEMYRQKLKPHGLILLHLSNRYLKLSPMIARIGATMVPPMKILVNEDLNIQDQERDQGKFPSIWAILATREEDLDPIRKSFSGWVPVIPSAHKPWTDNRTNLMDVLATESE